MHRAQGSEWEGGRRRAAARGREHALRPLVYTALTRARRHLSVVHAAGPAVARGVREVGSIPRRTRLSRLLREELAPPAPADPVAQAAFPVIDSA